MAHFAQINENNQVVRVIVVKNEVCTHNGNESEILGIEFCRQLHGSNTQWVQTSYNGNFRKNFAGIGYTYDAQRDAFVPPKPYPSWTLDEAICRWQPPVPCPGDITNPHTWDEATQAWIPRA